MSFSALLSLNSLSTLSLSLSLSLSLFRRFYLVSFLSVSLCSLFISLSLYLFFSVFLFLSVVPFLPLFLLVFPILPLPLPPSYTMSLRSSPPVFLFLPVYPEPSHDVPCEGRDPSPSLRFRPGPSVSRGWVEGLNDSNMMSSP